jgi:hypothetical protein
MFLFSSVTVTEYDSNPVLIVGSIRMTMSALDDWTVQTLAITDGIGNYNENQVFGVNPGQYSAASGKFFADNGGTAPHDTAGGYVYTVNRTGRVKCALAFPSVTTAGVGAVTLRLSLPFVSVNGGAGINGYIIVGGGYASINGDLTAGSQLATYLVYVAAATAGLMQNATLSIGSSMSLSLEYNGFLS